VVDTRNHKGLHPHDPVQFGAGMLPRLRACNDDLCWLLERGYQLQSALKLTGDRHSLTARQRSAVSRCACADSVARSRQLRMIASSELSGRAIQIDGFNVLTTLEVALSGGVVLVGRDRVMRDIAGVHGSYRSVEETRPALELLARVCRDLGIARCDWLLDAPVSNSGRLRSAIVDLAKQRDLPWEAHVVPDPDPLLRQSTDVVASADGQVLDAAAVSCNLAKLCIERAIPDAFVVDLSSAPDDSPDAM
jgi:hypothetical protein